MVLDGHIHIMNDKADPALFHKQLAEAGVDGGVVISLPPRCFHDSGRDLSPRSRLENLRLWVRGHENLFPFYWIDPLAESAIDGLLKVGLRKPDVVLLDAYMPGMNGIEVCSRLKSAPETAHIAVLAMSGRPSPELEQAFLDVGAAALLPKPITAPVVLQHLTALGLVKPLSRRRRGDAL